MKQEDIQGLLKKNIPTLVGAPLLSNYPDDLDGINWKSQDKKTYMEIEEILTDGVKFFDPIFVEEFYPQEMFDELVEICNSYDLRKIDYSNQMNKWEEQIEIPQKFIDYAIEKTKQLVGTDDILFGYHMYAHHQITSDGRVPKLPLHIDWAPGPYMVDLHIGGNRDWGFVARYQNFVTKPNQAIICQPQFDYHYRPAWGSTDPDEYYQAIFFHLVNKNHWKWPNGSDHVDESRKKWESKYNFGTEFRQTKEFSDYQMQKRGLFDLYYLSTLYKHDVPPPPWDEIPNEEDTHIHSRKNVEPAKPKEK